MLLDCGAGKGIEVVISPCSLEHYELKKRYALQDGNFFGLDQSEVITCMYMVVDCEVSSHVWSYSPDKSGVCRSLSCLDMH